MTTARMYRFGLVVFLAWMPACMPAPASPSEADVKAVVDAFYGGISAGDTDAVMHLIAPDAVFVDDPEWDKDAAIWRTQINFTLTAEDGKTPIGAATVEVNLTELERRQMAGI